MAEKTIDSRPSGMGDLVVSLWIAEGARACGERVSFVDGQFSEIVRAFGHETTPDPSEDCMALGTGSRVYNEELRTSVEDSSTRAIRWQRTMGWDFGFRRPPLQPLPDEPMGWGHAMTDGQPTVVIAPRANYDSRSMPIQKWIRVAWALHGAGIRTVAIDGSKDVVEAFPFFAYGFGWMHTLALLSQAAVVAGNDSGIAHLAATIGVETIATMGPTDPAIVFGHCLDVLTPVTSQTVECLGCHFAGARGYQVACDHGCEALMTLRWEAVRDAIVASLARADVGTRSAVPA